MPRLLDLLLVLTGIEVGVGTTFSAANDPGNPNPHLACYGRDLRDDRDLVVAHRTLPCRSKVVVCVPRTSRCAVGLVGDRGPYGRTKTGYRAIVDLSPAMKRQLLHNGRETVLLWSRKD